MQFRVPDPRGCAHFKKWDKVFGAVFCGISFLTPSHAARYTFGDVKGSSSQGYLSVSARLLETCEKAVSPLADHTSRRNQMPPSFEFLRIRPLTTILFGISSVLIACVSFAIDDDPRVDKELQRLKGRWKIVTAEVGGQNVEADEEFCFFTKSYSWRNSKRELRGTLALNLAHNPSQITFQHNFSSESGSRGGDASQWDSGIYKFSDDGDVLTVCIGGTDKFATSNEDSRRLYVLTRVSSDARSPIDDLASPNQTVRDKAAEVLRASFKSTPESKWTTTLEKFTKGQSKKEVEEVLRPLNAKWEVSIGPGQTHSVVYRLDNEWLLHCGFHNSDDRLIDRSLNRSLKHIWVAPPNTYTGVWTAYFINGQKSHVTNYKDGKYFGEFVSYHWDGSTRSVQHYSE